MKFRPLLLALMLVAGISLSSPAFAQDDKPKTQTPSSQTQPADQKPTTADQNQAQPTDQSQAQPADQKPTATDQTQGETQPVADQEQPTADQKDADKKDKKDKKDKDKKDKDKEKKEAKNKHNGGKDDVDAIGNRKIAGWDWYSIESEIRMGGYATQIEPA